MMGTFPLYNPRARVRCFVVQKRPCTFVYYLVLSLDSSKLIMENKVTLRIHFQLSSSRLYAYLTYCFMWVSNLVSRTQIEEKLFENRVVRKIFGTT